MLICTPCSATLIPMRTIEREMEFTDVEDLNVYVGTWNVGGKKAPQDMYVLLIVKYISHILFLYSIYDNFTSSSHTQ